MEYINKDGNITLGQILSCKVIENNKGQHCNLWFHINTTININTNTLVSVNYSLNAFEQKETEGYIRKNFNNYNEAKQFHDDYLIKYPIKK